MATPQDIAHALLHASEQIARKVTTEPTGVTPGYHAGLGATVREDGRLRHVGKSACLDAQISAPISVAAGTSPFIIDYDTVISDPTGAITTGATWNVLLAAGVYLVSASMEWASAGSAIVLGESVQLYVSEMSTGYPFLNVTLDQHFTEAARSAGATIYYHFLSGATLVNLVDPSNQLGIALIKSNFVARTIDAGRVSIARVG